MAKEKKPKSKPVPGPMPLPVDRDETHEAPPPRVDATPFTFHKNNQPDAAPHTIAVFRAGTSEPATADEIDGLLQRLNNPAAQ